MTFLELVAEVLVIVKRPDLTERVKQAVRAATLKIHHSDFYYKDLHEVAVEFDVESILQTFVPTEIISQFRKAKYIRYWAGDLDGTPGTFLTPIQIENSLDSYQYMKTNVFYMAGQGLQMRTDPAVKRILFGCYLHPVVTPEASYSSWVANEYPFAIIYEASRSIFRSISFNEQAAEYDRLTQEILSEIRISSIDDIPVT